LNANPFTGPWRIVWMSEWDQDCVDMDVPGHITFDINRSGSFQFGMVQGQMDCRPGQQPTPRIDFTWQGFDEGDELTGRGHAEIVDGELHGRLYIHFGDDSAFRAVKQTAGERKPSRKSKRV
jgi:hypothetical protein